MKLGMGHCNKNDTLEDDPMELENPCSWNKERKLSSSGPGRQGSVSADVCPRHLAVQLPWPNGFVSRARGPTESHNKSC